MRRLTAIVVLLLVVGLPTVGLSIAAPTSDAPATPTPTPYPFNGYCIAPPFNTVITCPASPTPTRVPILPTKLLTVSGGMAAPAGTTQYNVTITSSFVCFALNEPINVFTMGNPNAAAITPLFPTFTPSQGNQVTVNVEQNQTQPGAGTARLLLEVFNGVVGPEGLNLKAAWTQEGIERVVNIVPPAPPTATPTSLPGATGTSTPTASPTVTPTGTATATPTPAPTALTVRVCVQPLILNGSTLGGSAFTLYGQTTPGAVCTPSATDSTLVNSADALGQVAGSDGLVVFPFKENSAGDYGLASVTCTLNGQTATATTYFFILQKGQLQATQAAGCVPTSNTDIEGYATVSNLNPLPNTTETVSGCFFVNGAPVSGVSMLAVAHLSTGTVSCTATTNSAGQAQCAVNVDSSQPNLPVGVGVFFSYKGTQYFVPAAFTPASP